MRSEGCRGQGTSAYTCTGSGLVRSLTRPRTQPAGQRWADSGRPGLLPLATDGAGASPPGTGRTPQTCWAPSLDSRPLELGLATRPRRGVAVQSWPGGLWAGGGRTTWANGQAADRAWKVAAHTETGRGCGETSVGCRSRASCCFFKRIRPGSRILGATPAHPIPSRPHGDPARGGLGRGHLAESGAQSTGRGGVERSSH